VTDQTVDQALADAAAEVQRDPTDAELAEVARLAEQLKTYEDDIARAETVLANLQAAKRLLETRDLPDKLRACGLLSYTLLDGSEVGVKTVVSPQVKAEDRPKVHAWLRSIGQGDLVKHSVEVKLVRGMEEQAKLLTGWLAEHKLAYEDVESVHSQTLKAFVRHEVLAGRQDQLPKDTLGLFVGQVATVTRPK
jgi:hypothetical protein